MWEVKGTSISPLRFGPLEPLSVLNYYDGPRLFTFRDSDQALCLACWSDADDEHSRFLALPTSNAIVADLEAGIRTVREALDQPRLWVVDLSHEGVIARAWLIDPDDVPDDAQPRHGVKLHRSSELPSGISRKSEDRRVAV